MVYIHEGKVLSDSDPIAVAARSKSSGGGHRANNQGGMGSVSSSQQSSSSGGSGARPTGARPNTRAQPAVAARVVPTWLQPGTALGNINAQLEEHAPRSISEVVPPVVVVGVLGLLLTAGPQLAAIAGLVYFFSSQAPTPNA